MEKIVLIGCGVISTKYKMAFESFENKKLVAVCDTNENCIGRKTYKEYPFFNDYKEMISYAKPDYAFLSLPVALHYGVAKEILSLGVNVIVEKPMALSLVEIRELFDFANANNKMIQCLFHWQYANEILYLKKHIQNFGAIKSIDINVFDNYCDQSNKIKPEFKGLGGAWFDSGVNMLSWLYLFFDFSKIKKIDEKVVFDESLVVKAQKQYQIQDTIINIKIDWTCNNREKTSKILCEKGTLFIDHNKEIITLNDQIVYKSDAFDRLSSHYLNAFSIDSIASNKQMIIDIHKILFN